MKRRDFIASAVASLAAPVIFTRPVHAAGVQGPRLTMPPLLDTRTSGRLDLRAMAGTTSFGRGRLSRTVGFNQSYLGPTILVDNDSTVATRVMNTLNEDITAHWHGAIVPGIHDGGGHLAIRPGDTWTPEITFDQPPATLWYHSHAHRRTAAQVYHGLAGLLHLSDGRDDQRGLPSAYGIDDLSLVLQDRRFGHQGQMVYQPSNNDLMNGFIGSRMIVNGQMGAVAAVPKGLVRLRMLNASNARTLNLAFTDNRPMHLFATDGGFLPAALDVTQIRLAPAERIEVLVDFSAGGTARLISDPATPLHVLDFATDASLPVRITALPGALDAEVPDLLGRETVTRDLTLDMGQLGGMAASFGINGRPYDHNRIDFHVKLGAVERWIIRSTVLPHPFHVHGVQFRVLSENGRPPQAHNTGWKDVLLVPNEAEIIARFTKVADESAPYMFHCHILEHEDGGMMGQFTVG